jgi:hypothetical protein
MPFKPNVEITWEEAISLAAEIIKSLAQEDIPGPVKRRKAVEELKEAVDDSLTWGTGPLADLIEILDGVAAGLVIRFIVQSVYDRLKKDDELKD